MADEQLEDLTRQLRDSAEALETARGKLQGIDNAEAKISLSSSALTDSAKATADYTQRASELIGELGEMQKNAADLLSAAKGVLEGNELSELRQAVASSTESLGSRLEALEGTVSARLDDMQGRVANVEAVEAERDLLRRQLDHVRANVGARHLKRALETMPAE